MKTAVAIPLKKSRKRKINVFLRGICFVPFPFACPEHTTNEDKIQDTSYKKQYPSKKKVLFSQKKSCKIKFHRIIFHFLTSFC